MRYSALSITPTSTVTLPSFCTSGFFGATGGGGVACAALVLVWANDRFAANKRHTTANQRLPWRSNFTLRIVFTKVSDHRSLRTPLSRSGMFSARRRIALADRDTHKHGDEGDVRDVMPRSALEDAID